MKTKQIKKLGGFMLIAAFMAGLIFYAINLVSLHVFENGTVGLSNLSKIVPTEAEKHFRSTLKSKIANSNIVYFRDLVKDPWDTVCIIAPYEVSSQNPLGDLQKLIKADLSNFDPSMYSYGERDWLLVFIQNRKIVHEIRLSSKFSYHAELKYYNAKLKEGNCLDTSTFFQLTRPDVLFIKQIEE